MADTELGKHGTRKGQYLPLTSLKASTALDSLMCFRWRYRLGLENNGASLARHYGCIGESGCALTSSNGGAFLTSRRLRSI